MNTVTIKQRYPNFISDDRECGSDLDMYVSTIESSEEFFNLQWVQDLKSSGYKYWYLVLEPYAKRFDLHCMKDENTHQYVAHIKKGDANILGIPIFEWDDSIDPFEQRADIIAAVIKAWE